MNLLKVIVFVGCSVCLRAQTPIGKAWTILSDAAKNGNHDRKGQAVRALGLISGNARAQSLAEAALLDKDEDVRTAAADSLGKMHATGSVGALKAALKDPASSVVFAAANALLSLDDPTGYEVYYAVLTREKKSGDSLIDSQVKMLKDPKALSKIGFEEGIGFVPFGGVSYKVLKMATDDTESQVRAAAISKLTSDPDPRTSKALVNATKDPKWLIRAAATNAIAKRGASSMLPAVTALLDDRNDIVRYNAAAAVIHLTK